jgi:UDP-3-O-[3-hydroxymyristoyl] glucosamine N-acyltransferase
MSKTYTLAEIAQRLSAKLVGDAHCKIHRLAPISSAKQGDITFLSNDKYRSSLEQSKASAVILTEQSAKYCPTNHLIMKNPYLGFAKTAQLFDKTPKIVPSGIHPTVVIGTDCQIDNDVNIGAYAVLGDNVTIKKGTTIGAHTTIGTGTSIGEHCLIHNHVTIAHHIVIKNQVVIYSGAIIGSDGFGLAQDDHGQWINIPQQGRVVLFDHVNIGANTTVDRGTLEDTIIEEGVKIDNLVQIAHNVRIGAHTAIAACVGIAGSTTIGKHCIIAGAVGINGHISITDHVIITAMTGVSKSITQSGIYSSGFPAEPHIAWQKKCARVRRLDQLMQRVNKLETRYETN